MFFYYTSFPYILRSVLYHLFWDDTDKQIENIITQTEPEPEHDYVFID